MSDLVNKKTGCKINKRLFKFVIKNKLNNPTINGGVI